MKITANNITEVLISLIALAGEIPKDIRIAEVSERTLQNQISKAKNSKLFKVDQNHNRIRLKSPHGLQALEEMSPELYLHYNMVSNNHQFQTGKKSVLAQKQFSDTVLCMIKNGYEIDNFRIVHESNHFGKNTEQKDELEFVLGDGLLDFGMNKFAADGNIIPLIDSASLIPKGEKRFYTSRYLKYGTGVTDRINISRISGLMLSEGNAYNVYCLEDASRIFKSAETDMNNLLRKVYASAYGKRRETIEAIIITGMLPSGMSRLEDQFEHFYLIPDGPAGDFIIQILGCENWRSKLQTALYGQTSSDLRVDGIMNDTPSWELLSCEYSKITKVKKLAGSNPVNFIVYEWQVPIIEKKAKGTNYELQILNEEQKAILLEFMRGDLKI